MKITITTPFVSTNALYTVARNGRRIKTRAARASAEAIAWEAKSQFPREPLTNPINVKVYLFFANNRRRDLDNIKGLLDALTGVVWKDDSQIMDLHIMKYIDEKNPRVEIHI